MSKLTPEQEIEAFWTALHRSWDIEPREYFEMAAPLNGFDSALAMAVHYMWKRDVNTMQVWDRAIKIARSYPANKVVDALEAERDSRCF